MKAKKAFATKEEALREADVMGKRHNAHFGVYKCLYCDGWHTAKEYSNKVPEAPKKVYDVSLKSTHLDVEKALATNVPDIMATYGGLRGRTLSAARQHHAWQKIAEAGVRQIIDLRDDYISDEYTRLCGLYGMDYYKYPVKKNGANISVMVEKFSEFCSLIDKGYFYIACAEGLHRTDIALSCYWMFYAADKGIEPPVLNGYIKSKGHSTDNIMKVFGAFYNYVGRTTGQYPMPIEVFTARKEIIKRIGDSR